MFVCLDCGRVFSEPKVFIERHGFDYGPYEEFSGCPDCGGAYIEGFYCDCCDEIITGKYIKTENGDRICDECFIMCDICDGDV